MKGGVIIVSTVTVGVTEAHNRLSELIEAVQNGDTVEISKRGSAVAKIVPMTVQPDMPKGYGPRVAAVLAEQMANRVVGVDSGEDSVTDLRGDRESWERAWYQ